MQTTRTARAKTVAGYLAAVPARPRAALAQLRRTIRAAAPDATEGISYGIPTFRHRGGLVAYAAFKDHCSLFVRKAVLRAHAAQLRSYLSGKATIRFSAEQPLPAALVTKLVKACVAENERRHPGGS